MGRFPRINFLEVNLELQPIPGAIAYEWEANGKAKDFTSR